eukprot:CAMPEP_0170646484 /NCGR_PEP_ID=MMETSP0224-20130122/43665_1 /TAXON_ID=285029 /ORGANISM="Togula jolla, Strain CCCM 725" /LENGTH=56 /DNA_ID=CAMNT_0010977825 /DNA_START=23 /DNA_END=190 /DNA_ORIENTATION=-
MYEHGEELHAREACVGEEGALAVQHRPLADPEGPGHPDCRDGSEPSAGMLSPDLRR